MPTSPQSPPMPAASWGFGWASDNPALRQHDRDTIAARYSATNLATRYYNPDLHCGAFALPSYIAKRVEAGKMSNPIKYYFACISPWSYLGLDGLVDIASKHGRDIALMPIDVGRGWKETGAGRPLGERPEVLQSYRLIELPRWAAWRGVPINAEPKHFPVPFLLSSHVIIAARQAGLDTIGRDTCPDARMLVGRTQYQRPRRRHCNPRRARSRWRRAG